MRVDCGRCSAALLVVSFSILLYFGREIYVSAPPIPAVVQTTAGETLFTREQYDQGRQVWQRVGGQQMGSIWGHGSYVAPDWSADWLHREATALLDLWAQRDTGKAYADLDAPQQAALQSRLQQVMRTNTYDPATGVLTVDADRAQAIRQVSRSLHAAVRPRRRAEHPARAVCDPAEPDSRRRRAAGDDVVLLLDVLGDHDQPPGQRDQLHQQLAVRAAGRQRADDVDLPLDVHQHLRPAGGCRRAGLVLRRDARPANRRRSCRSATRSVRSSPRRR